MLKIYENLEAIENKAFIQHHAGDYTFSPAPTTFFEAYAERPVTLITFIDIDTYVDAANKGDLQFITNLKNLYGLINPTQVLVIALLYRTGGWMGDQVDDCNTALSNAGFPTYFDSGDATQYLPFMILRNNVWDGNSAAERYDDGFPSAAITKPFSYIIKRVGVAPYSYRVVDKWHMTSADNGDSGSGPGTPVDSRNLIIFNTLNTVTHLLESWNPTMDDLQAYAVKRIGDHLNDSPAITVDPTSGTTINNSTPIVVNFSEKAIDAFTGTHYSLENTVPASVLDSIDYTQFSDGGTDFTEYTVENYLNNILEKCTLNQSTIVANTNINMTVSGITDTDGNTFSSGTTASYSVDVEAPNAPVVTGTTPTTDTTPTWNWTSGGGGGNGTYRYKLDDSDMSSGTTETSSTTYTPGSVLAEGTHTLYVQERDAAGNWSPSGSCVIEITPDTTPPRILSVVKNPHLDK